MSPRVSVDVLVIANGVLTRPMLANDDEDDNITKLIPTESVSLSSRLRLRFISKNVVC